MIGVTSGWYTTDGGKVVAMGGVLARLGHLLGEVSLDAVDAFPDDPVDGQMVFHTVELAAFLWEKPGWALVG